MIGLKINIILFFISLSAMAQFSTKLRSIKLSTHPAKNCVIYEMDSLKLYFDKSDVVKVLKNDSLAYHDAADSALLRELQLHPKGNFTVKSTDTVFNPKTHYYNETNYEWATRRMLTYLLFGDDKPSIYDIKKRDFIGKIYVSLYDFDADIIGEYLLYDIYNSIGKVIYHH